MDVNRKMTYARALALPFSLTPVYAALGLLLQAVRLALAPLGVLVTAYFIDTALEVARGGWVDVSRIVPSLALICAFQVYGYIEDPFSQLLNARASMKTRRLLRPILIGKRARLSFKHLEDSEDLNLIERAWQNPEEQLTAILPSLTGFAVLLGTTLSYVIILLSRAWLAGLLLLVLSVPVFIIAIKAGKASYEAERETTERSRLHWTLNFYLTGREPACERNLFGYSDRFADKYRDCFESVRKWQFKVYAKWYARSQSSAIILGAFSAAALFMLAPGVASGALSAGLYISLIRALFTAINSLGTGLPNFFQQFSAQREYLRDYNGMNGLSEVSDAEAPPSASPPAFHSLEFKNVTFVYPGTEKKVLDNLSFVIEKGKHYALVGVNGSGKTTITKLIMGLYEYRDGEILLNGKPLNEYPLSDIKAVFCALFQDFTRYDITVAENVAIGRVNGAQAQEIDRALALSGFNVKSERLANGKDTLLGKTNIGGADLSGGEWQRLAFARAIVSPAAVKILDEPTAALDPIAERQMYAKFEEISRDTTTIFISHRLASARMADCIYVLDGGKVTEQGSHDALINAGGLYAEMFESQKSWYV